MKVLDLSHTLDAGISVWPGTEQPAFDQVTIDGCTETRMTLYTHNGTHLDAPFHIFKEGKSLDDFPADKFTGKGMVIDCAHLGGEEITPGFLQQHEAEIVRSEFVLFRSGWSRKWRTKEYFEDFPVLNADAARWLTQFGLKGIGLDCISLDRVADAHLPNHHIVLKKDILIIENLADLDVLPPSGFIFQCFPLKIVRADGSPTRAVALI